MSQVVSAAPTAGRARPSADDELLAPMPQRPLGKTGWNATLLTLGGVRWDTLLSESESVRLVHRALELGVTTFDTAHGYGRGQSERRLGIALRGHRDRLWINTKTGARDYDGARREMDESLRRLQTDHVDLMFVHGIGDEEDYKKITSANSVLKALDEYRKAGHVRFIGISGHHHKSVMDRLLRAAKFDAVLCPVGLANLAFDYSFEEQVIPTARQQGMAVLAMKVLVAGRARTAPSIEPYLRYAINRDVDTAVIGCESIEQLEGLVRIIKRQPPALPDDSRRQYFPEVMQITSRWEKGEFDYVDFYRTHRT